MNNGTASFHILMFCENVKKLLKKVICLGYIPRMLRFISPMLSANLYWHRTNHGKHNDTVQNVTCLLNKEQLSSVFESSFKLVAFWDVNTPLINHDIWAPQVAPLCSFTLCSPWIIQCQCQNSALYENLTGQTCVDLSQVTLGLPCTSVCRSYIKYHRMMQNFLRSRWYSGQFPYLNN